MIRLLSVVVALLSALVFLCMVINVSLYLGFYTAVSNPGNLAPNPFHLTVAKIWIIHCVAGFFAAMSFSRKRLLLVGTMGALSAAAVTGISFLYFGWRESLLSVEMIFPLILGILPVVKLYAVIRKKWP